MTIMNQVRPPHFDYVEEDADTSITETMPKQTNIHEGHKKTILHRVRYQISQSSNAAPSANKKKAPSTVATTLPNMISVAY